VGKEKIDDLWKNLNNSFNTIMSSITIPENKTIICPLGMIFLQTPEFFRIIIVLLFSGSYRLQGIPLYKEKELLYRLTGGDEIAFRELYIHYKNEVYSFALGITRSIPLAEEIVQDTFVKLWQHRDELPDIQKFEPWFFTIIRNLCYSALRKLALDRKTQSAHEKQPTQQVATAEEILITRENRELVQSAINQLPEQQRRVYLLSQDAGMTYEEIATELNISRNTVKEHLKRAKAAIKTYIEMRLAITITALAFLLHK
jgi:RNA polymerase sigma-70 factor (ECF subfamily)